MTLAHWARLERFMGQRGRAGSMIIASLYTSHLVLLVGGRPLKAFFHRHFQVPTNGTESYRLDFQLFCVFDPFENIQ
jgi:hypothetical protein